MGRNWLGGAVLLVVLEGGACGGKSTVTRGENGGEGDAHAELGGTGAASHGGIENGAGGAGHLGRGGAAAGKGGAAPGKGGAAGRKGGAGAAGRAGGSTTGGSAGQSGQSGEAGAGGGAEPPVANPARDIVRTELAFDVDTLTAVATITLGPSSSPGATFEAINLMVTSVTSGNDDIGFEVHDDQLDVALPASQTNTTVTIKYFFAKYSDFRGYSQGGYTFTWPDACGYLFPCHSAPADGTTFALTVKRQKGGLVYPTEIPFDAPSYMLGWAQGHYVEKALGTTSAGTDVSVFYSKDDANGDADATTGTARLVDAFDWYEAHLGTYHYGTKVASVSVPWPENGPYGGMEHHPYWHVASWRMGDVLTQVHEAAHGWFGNAVRIRCWADLVLSEGTVSYLSLHALEELGETTTAQAGWQDYEDRAQKYAATIAWFDTCVPGDAVPANILSDAVYAKGALFFRALEQRVGRETLIAALKTFYETWAGSAASMEDLLDSVHTSTGYDPKPCAESWLRTTALPAAEACE